MKSRFEGPALFRGAAYEFNGQVHQTWHCTADDRLHAVSACTDPALLREALDLEVDMQKTVRLAIERRLRKLERGQ